MIGHLQRWIEYGVEFPDHADEIGLAAQQKFDRSPQGLSDCRETKMFSVQYLLSLHQLRIKFRKWQRRRQDRMLDIKQPIVPCR